MQITLTGSVGLGGTNLGDDVRRYQLAAKRLAELHRDPRLGPGAVDGLVGSGTVSSIEHFQRRCHTQRPSGRVDVGGYTHRRLDANLRLAEAARDWSGPFDERPERPSR